ncbi:hypothetical protein RJ639_011584 [Escallonia herrerae]|uniref:Disease resistance RPP13-like protein 1 n=1 Tax=Escallonia herrerae TaxID=1293975 RepID=A0AA88VLM1_9ASTE|nr:hypothetical protein RJ639_011584 [Escallonia herrerae]
MVVIAEIFLSAFFTVLLEKLASGYLFNLPLPEGIYSRLQTWTSKLEPIQAVLSEAEEKQISAEAVNMWLQQLQDLAYDLDDLLDELATEALRRKLMMAQPTQASNPSMLRKLIPACCSTILTPRAVQFDFNISSEIDNITERLQGLLEKKSELNLMREHVGGTSSRRTGDERPPSTSLVDEYSGFYGREKDKQAILAQMCLGSESSSNRRFRVIPIVGMGGIGKTTLAQQIYNEVKNSFDLKAWICVSDEFDELAITERIYKQISSESCEFKDLEKVQVKLREIISKKKFLLILDDVWNEKYGKWDVLSRPFQAGAPGSTVIVTTRNVSVASIMRSVPDYHLDQLENKEICSILAQHARGWQNFDAHPGFKETGEAIAKKCKGLPLAAKSLARHVAGRVCFIRLEDKAESNVQHRRVSLLKARHSSFIRHEFDGSQRFEAFSRVRKLRTFLPLPVFKTQTWRAFSLTNQVVNDLLPQLHFLRVLSLSGYNILQLPNAIGNLKHLRYLNLSGTRIEQLPESVSELYNLQTLLLRDCRSLTKLPANTGNLINLRHLDVAGTKKLQEMPLGLCKMASLHTLSKIVLGGGLKVNELRDLSNLRGALSIIGLHSVMDAQDAREANLTCKQGLEKLEMVWISDFDDSRNEMIEREVIELLKPSTNLRILEVKHYGGVEFPSWLGDPSFSQLAHISLSDCRHCTSLPSLGHLTSLKKLHISGIKGVKTVGNELCGVGWPHVGDAFPSLETLKFVDMVSWEEWSPNLSEDDATLRQVFPRLRQLIIDRCPNLINISLPRLPSILVLEISQCQEVLLTRMVSVASATSTLKIREISGLVQLHEQVTQFLGESLEILVIEECNELVSLWEGDHACHNLANLREVTVRNCSGLVSLVGEEGQELPPNLEKLDIWSCDNLEKLPNRLKSLKSLKSLRIEQCPRLVVILSTSTEEEVQSNINDGKAEDIKIESFSQLEELKIYGCPSLAAFPLGQRIPATLKRLNLFGNCDKMEPDSEEMWLSKSAAPSPLLESISIHGWANLKFLPGCLSNFVHLTMLSLWSCPGLESFPERGGFPPSLVRLWIGDCVNLKHLIPDGDDHHQMQGLASLSDLKIRNCPNLEWLPRRCWPPNLKSLDIGGEIKGPSGGGGWVPLRLPASLAWLQIDGGGGAECWWYNSLELPENNSLAELSVLNLKNEGECIPRGLLQSLTSLERLSILGCPKFRSLPRGLLPTLSSLQIWGCPLLQRRCSKEKRGYWPLIANIPKVELKD